MSPQNNPHHIPPPALIEPDFQTIAHRLSGLVRFSGLRFHLEVGRVLIEDLYGGDLDAWRSRSEKDTSYRKLAALTRACGSGISRSVLHRAAQIYELTQRAGLDWEHLGVSHFRAVLPLCDDRQLALLRKAEAEHWTVRRLEAAVRLLRRSRHPAPPEFAQHIDALGQLTAHRESVFGGLERLDHLSEDEIRTLSQKLLQVQKVCADLQQHLHRAL